MNYFKNCREFTLELSDEKTPNPIILPDLWDANYPSLLNYMNQALYGLRGIVTDSITGKPIKAKIEIIGHDIDSSHVYSNLPIGNYHRYLMQANYDITFSKNGYYPKTINTTILNNNTTIENIQLVPVNTTPTYINEEIINTKEKLFIDILGKKIKPKSDPFFYINHDGSVKKRIVIENPFK